MSSPVAKLVDVLASIAAAVRTAPKLAAQWLTANAAKVVAVAWLGGLATFGYTTVQRARALRAAEAAAPKTAEEKAKAAEDAKAAQPEVVAMLDVDQMNQIRADRMHANGIEAAGDEGAPDLATMEEARERRKNGVKVEGEVAGQAGGVVVVTKGGIKGWLARNKGKKADPETLAWLRQEEAAEGRKAYAGWADREDGSILNYAKEEKKNGTLGVGAGSKNDLAAIENGGIDPNGPRPDEPVAVGPPVAGTPSVAGTPPVAVDPAVALAPPATVTPPVAVTPVAATDPVAVAAPPIARLDMHALGEAARTALTNASKRPPITDPTPDEIEAVKKRLAPITSALVGAGITTTVRDHHIVLVLVADQLFASGEESLSPTGKRVVRNLATALRNTPNMNVRLAIDPDRAMEMAATLVVSGMDADRLDVSLLEKVDRAIDIIEIVLYPTDYGDVPAEGAK